MMLNKNSQKVVPAPIAVTGGGRKRGDILIDEAMIERDAKFDRIAFTIKDLDVHQTLDVGHFSRLQLVRHKKLNQHFALKAMIKGEIIQLAQMEHVKQEISILQKISSPFFPTLYGFFQDELRLYLLLHHVPGGDLFHYLEKVKRVNYEVARFYVCQVIAMLEYLHNLNIIHRGIRPENLMLTIEGNLVLGDFSFAKVVPQKTFTLCGSPEYISPEVLEGKGYGKASDWWALGILTYELLAGTVPFTDHHPYGIYKKIEECKPTYDSKLLPPYPLSDGPREFIQSLLIKDDRSQRLGSKQGTSQIMKHRWFKRVDWSTVRHRQVQPPYKPSCPAGLGDASNHSSSSFPDTPIDYSYPLSAEERKGFNELAEQLDEEWAARERGGTGKGR